MANLDTLIEAEKRGILPENKKELLAEARRRGLVSVSTIKTTEAPPRITKVPDIREAIPEVGAATLAGLKFGARRFPVVAGAIGIASALGEAGRQAIFEEQPMTLGERLKLMGMAGLRGVLGVPIGKGIGKLFSPFRGGVTPQIEAGRKIAEEVGITPPLGTLTESRAVQVAERGLEFTPFGQAITRLRLKALEDFGDFTKSIGKKIAVDRPPEVTGNLAKEVLNELPKKFGETTDKLYDSVLPLIKKANPEVEISNTINRLKEIIENRSGVLEPEGLGKLRGLLKKFSEIKPSLATFEIGKESSLKTFGILKKERTNLGLKIQSSFQDPTLTGLSNDLKGLYGAMTEDMNKTVRKVSKKAFADLQTATNTFREGQILLKDSLFKNIAKSKPENVYKLVIVPGSPSQATLGRELLGDTFDDVARQWFDDILRKSTTPEGIISPIKIAKRLQNYDSVLPIIAEGNPELLVQFDKLKQIANLLSKGREVSQGSITVFGGAGLTTFGATIATIQALFTNPKLAAQIASGVAATGLGVKGITSGIGREFLTRGFPRVGKVAERIVQPTAQLGLQRLQAERVPLGEAIDRRLEETR